MKRINLLFAIALFPAALAGQQATDPGARIEAALQRAQAAGVPASLLQNRIAEGRAKGVPMERIAAAVERRSSALVSAQDLMQRTVGPPSGADISSAADAFEAGIEFESVAEVARLSSGEDRAVAIAVLTYLHDQQGLPVDQAVASVRDALNRGPEALRNLPAQAAARGRGQGGPPAGAGPPAGVGRGNGGANGPPQGVPGPGQRPGGGPPQNPGSGNGGQGGPPSGVGGGPPGG